MGWRWGGEPTTQYENPDSTPVQTHTFVKINTDFCILFTRRLNNIISPRSNARRQNWHVATCVSLIETPASVKFNWLTPDYTVARLYKGSNQWHKAKSQYHITLVLTLKHPQAILCQLFRWDAKYASLLLSRGGSVQLKRGTVETKIKKGVRYFLVVLKKSPFEYHMGKQLCVEFGWNRLRTSAAIDVFVFWGLFVNASGAVKKTDFRPNLKAFENWKYTNWSYFSSLSIGSKCTAHAFQMAFRFYG